MAYDRLEPIGDRRNDLLFAQLYWMVYQLIRVQGAKLDDKSIADFVPQWWNEDEEVDETETSRELLAAKAARAFSAFGGGIGGS